MVTQSRFGTVENNLQKFVQMRGKKEKKIDFCFVYQIILCSIFFACMSEYARCWIACYSKIEGEKGVGDVQKKSNSSNKNNLRRKFIK